MTDTERFKIKEHDLISIVQELNPSEYKHELNTYDFIMELCEKEYHKILFDLDKIFKPLSEVKDFSEQQKLIKNAKKETLYWRIKHKHDPAFIIVHNFGIDDNYDYKKHLSRFVEDKDIVGRYYLDPEIIGKTENLSYGDGATLIDENQRIVYTHAHIINLNPHPLIEKYYAESLRKNYTPSSPKYFGFRQDVNTRHLSALYASFHFPKSIIYTLGESLEVKDENGEVTNIEDGHIRRYQDGLITFSTYDRELDTVKRSLSILKK